MHIVLRFGLKSTDLPRRDGEGSVRPIATGVESPAVGEPTATVEAFFRRAWFVPMQIAGDPISGLYRRVDDLVF